MDFAQNSLEKCINPFLLFLAQSPTEENYPEFQTVKKTTGLYPDILPKMS